MLNRIRYQRLIRSIGRRGIITCNVLAILWLLFVSAVGYAQYKNVDEEFSFAVIADVHFGAFPASQMWLDRTIAEMNAMQPRPAFVLSCGDLTEIGSEAEMLGYRESLQQSTVPFYNALGNHDAKWSDQGKARFRQLFGPTYYSFDYGRYHFIALDISVTLQQYAHIEKAQLDWLQRDLKSVGRARPVILFMHHPIGRWKTFADNQYQIIKALFGYNVKLILQGHEHHEEIWNENGITQVESDNLYGNRTTPGRYRLVRIKNGVMTIFSKRPEVPGLEPIAVVNVASNPRGYAAAINLLDDPVGDRFTFTARVNNRELTPSYIGQTVSDDGTAWTGYYQFSLRPSSEEAWLKVRVNRNSRLLAIALQARQQDGTWHLVDSTAKPADDMRPPDDNRFWTDLKLRIPRATAGPFRLVSFEPSAPEINAFRIWLLDAEGARLDEIDVGNVSSETAHAVSVNGQTWSGVLTSSYPTAVRYWIDLGYASRRPMIVQKDGLWQATVSTSGLKPGRHTLKVQAFDDAGAVFTDYTNFTVRRGPIQPMTVLPTGGGIQSSPTLANGILYVGSNDGAVYAFNPPNPDPVWTFQTDDQVISSPTVADGVVYVGSADYKLYALDAATGVKLWEFATRGPIFGAPEIADGVLYFGSGDHNLYAVDAATGAGLWSFTAGNLIQMKPTYNKGTVYFGAWDNFVYALTANDGRLRWRTRIGSSIYFSPAQMSPSVIGNKVLVSAPTGFNYFLDAETGGFIGDPFPSTASAFGYNAAWVQGTTAYVVSFNGLAIAYDTTTAPPSEIWRRQLGSPVVNSGLVRSGELLLSGGLGGTLITINMATGTLHSTYQLASEGFVFSVPYADDRAVYLGTLDGNVYVATVNP